MHGKAFKRNLKSGSSKNLLLGTVSGLAAGALMLMGAPHKADAWILYNGENYGNNLEINLTTELQYSAIYRVNDPSAILTSPANANGSEGDIDFRHGIVSNQVEALPVLDIRDGDYGAHLSGELYLNTPYLGTNQNNQPDTLNPFSVAKNTDFTSATRNIDGENARVLDAFIFARHTFGDGQTLSFKVGRQTLLWGQSLLLSSDAIAGGQAPIDIILAQNTPNAETQQVVLPVGQAVVTYQPFPGTGITLQGYYQFEWAHDNFQGVGAYFNSADILDKGGQRILFGATPTGAAEYFFRTKDLAPPNQNGQFGFSIQAPVHNIDLGLYALRFNSKTPEFYLFPGVGAGPTGSGVQIGTYRVVYPRDIGIFGASASGNVGPTNMAGEISGRINQPLVSGLGEVLPGSNANGGSHPLWAVGDTVAANLSCIYISPGIPLDPGGVSFTGEIEMNHVVSVTKNRSALTPGRQATAGVFQFILTPTYDDVLPSLNITFPIGIQYNYLGRSEMDGTINHGTGNFNIGVAATYKTVWTAGITYFDYLGKADPTLNGLADRGYVSFTVSRTF